MAYDQKKLINKVFVSKHLKRFGHDTKEAGAYTDNVWKVKSESNLLLLVKEEQIYKKIPYLCSW